MAQVSGWIQIDADPAVVWALVSDPHRYPDFADPTERMVDIPDGDVGVGYVYREYGGVRPFIGESRWEITVFDPIRRQVHVGDDGHTTVVLDIELVPVDGGTRYGQSVDVKPRWYIAPINALLWPVMMRKRSQEAIDKTLANVKRIAESTQ